MRHVFYLMVAACVLCVVATAGAGRITRLYEGDNILCDCICGEKEYVFAVDDDTLANGSVWGDGERLRCSAKTAQNAAKKWLNANLSKVDNNTMAWECTSMRLDWAYGDVWCWVIESEYTRKVGGTNGQVATFAVPVLAGGVVPPPKVHPVKGKKHDDE